MSTANRRASRKPAGSGHFAKRSGAPGRTRTCDPRLRRPVLYPTELRARPSIVLDLDDVAAHDTRVMRQMRARVACVLCAATLGATLLSARPEQAQRVERARDSWPRFRGTDGGVAADDPSLPDVWGPSQNIAWTIDVPGRSWSSPVVWGDHIFITTAMNTIETETLLPVASYVSRSNGGTMTFMDVSKPTVPHRWIVYDVDFKTGRIRWERTVRTGVP